MAKNNGLLSSTRQERGERPINLRRLCHVVPSHRLVLQHFRDERTAAVREYAGNHWSTNAAPKRVPINLLAKYVEVVAPKLISKNPRFLFSTFNRQMKPRVQAMETWANRESERMRLGTTMQRGVVDALFCMGVAKVALASPSDAANGAWAYQAGVPFCEIVDLDDFVCDTRARDFRECSYIGHRYRVPLDVIRDDSNYSKYRKELTASENNPYNTGGDERIRKLGEGYMGETEDFEDMVDLWEIYLPRHKLVVTLADDGGIPQVMGNKSGLDGALRVQKWLGPECGPYHFLTYGMVPGNLMPKARIQDLRDLHDATNEGYRKLTRQAGRQKQILGVGQSAVEDGQRIVKAEDGDVVPVTHADQVKLFNFGGPDQQNLGFSIHMRDLFSWVGGNLDILGGLSPQSKTARQDMILQQNSSSAISDLQESTISWVASIGKALAWYWWNDPVKVIRVQHELPGMPQFNLERVVTPQDRQELPFDELDLKIDPYSLQYQSPQQKLASLNQVMTQIVLPLAPILGPQGITPDMNEYLQQVARLSDMRELTQIVTVSEPMVQGGPAGGGERPRLTPGSTERNYTRENIPAASEDAGMSMMKESSQQTGEV